MSELPLVHLTGTPFERGRQHGVALSDRIASNVDLYRTRMRLDAQLSDADLAERTHLYLDVFTTLSADYRATMEGIAAGSGQSLDDITMLNARFELLYSAWSARGTTASECTGFAAGADITADGEVLIGQNWDWFPAVAGGLLSWQDDGLKVLAYTEAGIAGAKIGVNSAGIGLCVNGLGCDADDWKRGGMPYHLRTNRILNSAKMTAALSHATLDAPSCSANFLIGSATEGVVNVESSPVGARRILPEPGRVYVHANHFTTADELGVTQQFRSRPITTFHRAERLTTLLNDGDKLTADKVTASLRDHDGGELGLCRHPMDYKPEHLRTHTAFSALLHLAEGRMSYTDGPPCESTYTDVVLSDVS
ncbi:MAG TPA: C45 family peptidase [Stackebrandtia sp.]|jgi:isopenicillin-N N-acyltransferase-like protein|uniref:C45 family peptidase n=1 Tax=Stackebrandtia sp. TaxID=2023065 RepID=UPI002D7559E0|nr:C45 family peptidase [Stackebrandtia sp.]HZE40919.1 C45 family peptidase [Stackebrandtia sp.]